MVKDSKEAARLDNGLGDHSLLGKKGTEAIADMDLDHDSLSQDKKVICSDVLKDTAAAIPAFVKIHAQSWNSTPWLSNFYYVTLWLVLNG